MKLAKKGAGFEFPDAGVYTATLTDYEEWVESEWNGVPRVQLLLKFAEVGGPATFRVYSGYTETGEFEEVVDEQGQLTQHPILAPSVHEKSKLGRFLRSLGVDPDKMDEGECEDFDLGAYRHKPVQLIVVEYKRANGEKGTKVDNILPVPKPRPTPTAPARPTAPVARPVRRSAAFDEGDA